MVGQGGRLDEGNGGALEIDGADKPVDRLGIPPVPFSAGNTLNTLSSSTGLEYVGWEVRSVEEVAERRSCLG
jgi:hypothetical protein